MYANGRALAISGPNETLVGGVGDTEGAKASTAMQGGAGVGMTRQGGVGD